jgi:hypothetical protein
MASAAKAGRFNGTLIGTPEGVPFRSFHTDSLGGEGPRVRGACH